MMVTPRSIAMGFVGRMDLAHPSAADRLAIKTSGFSFRQTFRANFSTFRIFKFGHKEERLAQITTGLGKPHPGDTIPLLKSSEFDVPGP